MAVLGMEMPLTDFGNPGSAKSGARMKKKKAQYGTPPLGSANPPLEGSQYYPIENQYQSQGVFDMYGGNQSQQYLPQGQSQGFGNKMFNKAGGWGGIMQGAGNIASGAAMGDQQIQGGPSTAQNVVGQFGPWGKVISGVSQFATKTLNKSDNEFGYNTNINKFYV